MEVPGKQMVIKQSQQVTGQQRNPKVKSALATDEPVSNSITTVSFVSKRITYQGASQYPSSPSWFQTRQMDARISQRRTTQEASSSCWAYETKSGIWALDTRPMGRTRILCSTVCTLPKFKRDIGSSFSPGEAGTIRKGFLVILGSSDPTRGLVSAMYMTAWERGSMPRFATPCPP